ncbi:9678_t:CDS:2, partial [Funneliformis mosseae]
RKVQMISYNTACNTISTNVEKIKIQMKNETEAFTSAKDFKRKREDNESNKELASLFDKSNKDILLKNIDEKVLEKEKKLPL